MVWEKFTTATVFSVLCVCVFSLPSNGMTPKPKFPSTMWGAVPANRCSTLQWMFLQTTLYLHYVSKQIMGALAQIERVFKCHWIFFKFFTPMFRVPCVLIKLWKGGLGSESIICLPFKQLISTVQVSPKEKVDDCCIFMTELQRTWTRIKQLTLSPM